MRKGGGREGGREGGRGGGGGREGEAKETGRIDRKWIAETTVFPLELGCKKIYILFTLNKLNKYIMRRTFRSSFKYIFL